jgi:hypothetical protein
VRRRHGAYRHIYVYYEAPMAGQRLCFGWPGSADRGRRRQAGVILRTGRALLSEVSLFEVVPRPPRGAGGEENG